MKCGARVRAVGWTALVNKGRLEARLGFKGEGWGRGQEG